MKNMLVALLLASSLGSSNSEGSHRDLPAGAVKAPNYWTKFEGLGCCIVIDSLHTKPKGLQPGQGGAEESAVWIAKPDALRMELKAPRPLQPNTPSMGIFKTDQNFGPGTHFSLSATFRSPEGRMDPPAPWTVVVVARTGKAPDLSSLGRLQLSLRVRNGVHLRVQEGANAPSAGPIGPTDKDFGPTDIAYKEIYVEHKPFTLRLDVNRKSGTGVGTLTTATQVISIPFEMALYKKDSGPALTTVGTAMANNIPGETVSVEVTDIMIAKH